MICEAILAAADDTRLTAAEFRVFANIAKGYQTRADIARGAKCGESTVPRAVRKLISHGYLERQFNDGRANTYVVRLPSPEQAGINNDTGVAKPPSSVDTGISTGSGSGNTGAAVETPDDTATSQENQRGGVRVDTGIAPPKDNNQNPPELNPEPVELGSTVVVVRASSDTPPPPAWQRVADEVGSPWLDPNKSHGLILTGPRVQGWIDAGADEALDIVPTVRRICAAKRERIATWEYFHDAVRTNAARRKAAEVTQDPIKPEEANHGCAPSASGDQLVRRERVSPTTAARMRRREARHAERDAIDLGRVESERL